MSGRRVVGLDPGLETTGYGVVDVSRSGPVLVEAGVLRVSRNGSLADRLAKLHRSAQELLEEQKPAVVAIEELFSHYDRPRTAILMGHARGVLLLAAAERGLEVSHYLPTRVKKTMTGNGHASKAQIQKAVALEFGLADPIAVPDVADALAVALCHYHAMRLGSRTA